ncbi:finger and BTB domain-containing 14-like [Octopus vulgaris]|uniref:Finger and BTB domain-containing 14-like n=1 Tax=Octopus vulgaris TaxID=6645 RepID=A0AA36BSV7_OCTVU|nr:finger and BTB domain-containing 14-like [Octopus vulgaris]
MCTCSLCSKTFTSKSSLTTHMRSHYGVKPYQCDICKKRFTRNTSLNYHKLVHEEKFRFTCKLCDKHFRHRGHFNDHVLKHFIDEPFECGRCHKTFPSRQKSRDHVKVCNETDATPSKTMQQKVHEAHWQYFLHGEVPFSIHDIAKDERTHNAIRSHSTPYRYFVPILHFFRGNSVDLLPPSIGSCDGSKCGGIPLHHFRDILKKSLV